jgi:hypothetical protein
MNHRNQIEYSETNCSGRAGMHFSGSGCSGRTRCGAKLSQAGYVGGLCDGGEWIAHSEVRLFGGQLDAKRANRGLTPAADSWCEIPINGICP